MLCSAAVATAALARACPSSICELWSRRLPAGREDVFFGAGGIHVEELEALRLQQPEAEEGGIGNSTDQLFCWESASLYVSSSRKHCRRMA